MRGVIATVAVLTGIAHADVDPPRFDSPSVAILDVRTHRELVAKHADEPRAIASMTKIFVALVLRKHKLDLDGWSEITDEDAKLAEGGAGTRLLRGETFKNLDLLHAMLLVSDNRVPSALARSVKLSPNELLTEMNELAEAMGLEHTRFVDTTGIHDNQSTARELAIALDATLADPVLARIMRTRYARITSKTDAVSIDYKSTVQPLWSKGAKIRGGKTGTTEAAGHCMLIGIKVGEHDVVMAFLGGETAESRFIDYARAVRWLEHDVPK